MRGEGATVAATSWFAPAAASAGGLTSQRLVAEAGRWTAVEPSHAPRPGDRPLPPGIALPALVDLHGHVGAGVGPFAVPVEVALAGGVTAICSQGDAGPRNFEHWRQVTSSRRALLALNLAPLGEAGGDGHVGVVTAADVDAAVALAQEEPATVRMLAVNLGSRTLGDRHPGPVLELALRAADRCALPLLVGLAAPDQMALADQLERLRAGDVVTYCYRSRPWCLFPPTGAVPGLAAARERGVLLDVGHGTASFDAAVARRAIAAGFAPDTISSDLQLATLEQSPPLHLPAVLERVVAAGLDLRAALAAVGATPGRVLGLDHTAVISPGAPAELVLLTADGPGWTARHWTPDDP